MNIDQFHVMDAVVKHGSFRAAAEATNRVQSAVSYNIKTLEDELGIKLFTRESYRPALTPEGEIIYRQSKFLLAEAAKIASLGAQFTQGQEPVVAIDVTPLCPIQSILPALKTVAQRFPHTQIKLSMEPMGGEHLTREEDVDMAVTDIGQREEDLEYANLAPITMIPVAAADHPLLQDHAVTPEQLMQYPQIVVGSKVTQSQKETRGVLKGAMTWRVSDFPAKQALLLAGLGWGNMPCHLIQEPLKAGQLKTLEIPGWPYWPNMKVTICLVKKRGKVFGKVRQLLWDQLLENLGLQERIPE